MSCVLDFEVEVKQADVEILLSLNGNTSRTSINHAKMDKQELFKEVGEFIRGSLKDVFSMPRNPNHEIYLINKVMETIIK